MTEEAIDKADVKEEDLIKRGVLLLLLLAALLLTELPVTALLLCPWGDKGTVTVPRKRFVPCVDSSFAVLMIRIVRGCSISGMVVWYRADWGRFRP